MRRTNRIEKVVLTILVALALFSVFISGIHSETWFSSDWSNGILGNLGTELLGAVATFVAFELVVGARRKEQEEQLHIESDNTRLLLEIASGVNDISRRAVEELRRKGFLTNGRLKGINLRFADLSGANLREADLESAILNGTNLNGATLALSNLQQASMIGTNLEGASLRGANLSNADLSETVFWGANLFNANLSNAETWNVRYNAKTMLPNGKYWTPQTDMRCFTDPKYPEFWKPSLNEE